MNNPAPPRIGYVVKRYPRYSETFVVNEVLAHEAAGAEIELFALRPPNDTHFQDILAQVRAPVTYIESRGVKSSAFWAALQEASRTLPALWGALEGARGEESDDVYQAVLLAAEVRQRGITHLHAHFATVATTVARLAARFAGIPYSFTAHAKDIFHESVEPRDMRRKLCDAAAVVTVSDYNVAYLRERYGMAGAKVQRLYNGLNLDRFPFQPPAARGPRLLAIGRLVEKKGFDYLLDACALLAARGRPFECEIVGAGELEPTLRRQIADLGLGDRVRLVGPRPQSEIIAAIADAAMLVVPSIIGSDGNREGLPTVLLEALALGTPAIATDIVGIPELLRDGESGLLVPERDAAALAAAVELLLDEPALGARLAARARRRIEADFDIRTNAATLRALFAAAGRTEVAAEALLLS